MITDEVKLLIEIGGFIIVIGTILWRLGAAVTSFTLIGQQQANEIKEIKVAMEKLEAAVAAIAIYDVKLTALISRMDSSDKRNDDRFASIDRTLDDFRHGRGFITRPS